jgi:opacity protein-like surface antigen
MLRAFCSFSLTLVILSACTNAQEADVPWLSLKRLSVMANASYHYVPWKKYNESLLVAQDAIRYSPSYPDPRGELEKVLGDGTFDFTMGYRIISGLSFGITAGYLRTGSDGYLSYNPGYTVYVGGEPVADAKQLVEQNIRFSAPYLGVGFRYTHHLTGPFRLFASASFERYYGLFSFHYEDIQPWQRDLFSADLRETRFGFRCGVGLSLRVDESLSASAAIDYRWLRFEHLRGGGTYSSEYRGYSSYGESYPFNAQLGEADGYFGLHIATEDQPYVSDYLLHTLWRSSAAGPWWKTQPASLDLSGFGLTMGLSYVF